MTRRISQREARRTRKQLVELEARMAAMSRSWLRDWPGGVHIASATIPDLSAGRISCARMVGRAVVATIEGNEVRFFAVTL